MFRGEFGLIRHDKMTTLQVPGCFLCSCHSLGSLDLGQSKQKAEQCCWRHVTYFAHVIQMKNTSLKSTNCCFIHLYSCSCSLPKWHLKRFETSSIVSEEIYRGGGGGERGRYIVKCSSGIKVIYETVGQATILYFTLWRHIFSQTSPQGVLGNKLHPTKARALAYLYKGIELENLTKDNANLRILSLDWLQNMSKVV